LRCLCAFCKYTCAMSEFDDDDVLSDSEGEGSDGSEEQEEAGHEPAAHARSGAGDGGDRFVLEEEAVPSLMDAGNTDAALLQLQVC
jgi:hypothetical protein